MKKQNNSGTNSVLLRKKAEKLLKKESGVFPQSYEVDVHQLIHELEVYQIELEMQNEELKLAKEKEAELATNKYVELYDFAPAGYFTLSESDTIMELNLGGAQMLGEDRINLINSRFSFFVSPDTKPDFRRFLEKAFNSTHKVYCEVTLSTNVKIPVSVYLSGIVPESSYQCFVTAIDITERRRAEEALHESEERLHSLFDNMNEGVALHELVFVDRKPVNYRIIQVNKSFVKLIGLSRDQVAGLLSTEAYDEATPPYFNEFTEVVNTKEPTYFETYFAAMDKHFAISVAPWRENGFATIFMDISDRKHAEEEITRKNEELQKTNAEKDKFFSIIAHDLRSPFNSFLGLTQYMVEESQDLTLEVIKEVAETLKNSATNLYNLLENLLHWARMQQGLIPFNPDFVELKPLIQESLLSVQGSAKAKGIEYTTDILDNLNVFADRNMLLTVIRNLVTNAVKFTSKGGKITISAKSISGNTVQMVVQDTGIGMNTDMINNLFRIDVQTSRNGTSGEPSTGLGLLLCKEFAEKNGGQIWAESEEGRGSTFYFTIPEADTKK